MPELLEENVAPVVNEQRPRSRDRSILTIDEPRQFQIDELFFSITDRKGIIRAANEIFTRVSAYSWTELQNKPHNVIRHPDTPRCVFQILWDTITAGRPVVAYVKNRAKDGRYYWVVALVVPIADGYLSVRFKPSSDIFPAVRQLYAELCRVEATIEAQGGGRKAAITASVTELQSHLRTKGFADYDAFMRHVLQYELSSRDNDLRRSEYSCNHGSDSPLMNACTDTLATLRRVFEGLHSWVQITADIRARETTTLALSDAVRYLSLNAALEAVRLGQLGATLNPIFHWLSSTSRETAQHCNHLSAQLSTVARLTESLVFDISAGRLQMEMIHSFAAELVHLQHDDRRQQTLERDYALVATLQSSLQETLRSVAASFAAVQNHLATLRCEQESVLRSIRHLTFTYLAGKVEIARLASGQRLDKIFLDLAERLRTSGIYMRQLRDAVAELHAGFQSTVCELEAIQHGMARIESTCDVGSRALAANQSQIGRDDLKYSATLPNIS